MTEESARVTWNRCALYVIVAWVLGIGLSLFRPFWFKPPLVGWTPLFYQIVALVWVAVLLVCILLRPRGKPTVFWLLVVVGLLLSACHFITINPISGWVLKDAEFTRCESVEDAVGSLVVCTYQPSESHTQIYTFREYEGQPFMTLVDFEYTGS